MNWIDLGQLLIEAIGTPAVLLVSGLCVFICGVLAGMIARDMAASDTRSRHITGLHTGNSPLTRPTRRVRALGDDLKPSYDSRKHEAADHGETGARH